MECPSCGASWRAARFCGRCGGRLDVEEQAGFDDAALEVRPELGRRPQTRPRHVLGLGVALASVALVAGLGGAALPDAAPVAEDVDLPAAAALPPASEPERAMAGGGSPAFDRVIDCSPALEKIGDAIVRQMRRSKLVERRGERLCLVLTEYAPSPRTVVRERYHGRMVVP